MTESEMSRGLTRLTWAVLVLVLVVSLFLRLHQLDVFLTIDEPNWHDRSIEFWQALSTGEFADTYRSAHPGVVTMWSGVVATRIVAWRLGEEAVVLGNRDGLGLSPVTVWARRIVALITWLGVVALFVLLRRTWGHRVAVLGAVLVALDPFFLAHSRVHHLDGLLTTFVMLSVVSLASYLRGKRPLSLLLLSGVMAGLAMVNKAPGMFLAPWAALAIGWTAWRGGREGRRRRLVASLWPLLAWGGVAAVTVFAVWPALWVDPAGTLGQMVEGALEEGTQPHGWSNYFWFLRRDDPGLGFYPVAWVFRTTAPVMLGLLAMIHTRRQRFRGLGPLLLFVVGYALFVSASPKKFDRYLLPIFPLVDLLAAAGLAAFLGRVRTLPWAWARSMPYAVSLPTFTVTAMALVAVAQVALLWPSRPYYLSYYNPLAGGPKMAARILLVGWGEAAEQAALYMNEKPNAQNLVVATDVPKEFAPYFVGTTRHIIDQPVVEPDYFVFYLSHDQRNFSPELRALFREFEPERVFSANGIDYVRLYRNEAYEAETLEVLEGVAQRQGMSDELVITNADLVLAKKYGGALTLATVSGPAREDFALTQLRPVIDGYERVWLLTFPDVNEESADLLDDILDLHSRKEDYLEVNGVAAARYAMDPDAPLVPRPTTRIRARLGDAAILTGCNFAPTALRPGDTLSLRLYWYSRGPTEKQYKVFTHLLGPDGQIYGQSDSVPQGGAWPTVWWRPEQRIIDDYEIAVSPDAPPGEYVLALGMYDMDTMARLPACTRDEGCNEDGRLLIEGLRVVAP